MENPFLKVPEGVRIREESARDTEHVFSRHSGHFTLQHPAVRIHATAEAGLGLSADVLIPDVRSQFVPDKLKPFFTDIRRKRAAVKLGKQVLNH